MAAFQQFKAFHTSRVWRFPDPDSGFLNVADNKADLIRSIVSYRANNQLPPIEHLDRVLENYLCGLPENDGNCAPCSLERGWLMTIKGGVSLLEWALFPVSHTVDQEEAEKRAAQCAECPKNMSTDELDRPNFDRWTDQIALSYVGDKRTTKHNYLGNCVVCTCVLKAAIWYKGDPKFTPEQRKEAETVGCWKLKFYDKGK